MNEHYPKEDNQPKTGMRIGNRERHAIKTRINKELRKYEWVDKDWEIVTTRDGELLIMFTSGEHKSAFKITSAGMAPLIPREVERLATYLKKLNEHGPKTKHD